MTIQLNKYATKRPQSDGHNKAFTLSSNKGKWLLFCFFTVTSGKNLPSPLCLESR